MIDTIDTTVTTYADGKGRWYARVDFTNPVGPHWLERNIDSIRQKARRAIRTEIKARQAAPPADTWPMPTWESAAPAGEQAAG